MNHQFSERGRRGSRRSGPCAFAQRALVGVATAVWATPSFGHAAQALRFETSALGEHLAQCRSRTRRLSALGDGGAVLRRFLGSRIVSMSAALALLIGGGALAIIGFGWGGWTATPGPTPPDQGSAIARACAVLPVKA